MGVCARAATRDVSGGSSFPRKRDRGHRRMIIRHLVRRLVVLLAVPLIACGGQDFTDPQAKNYFDQHEQTFAALVHLISQCEGKGTTSIYPDGQILATRGNTVRCPSTEEISTQLKSANILWVNVSGVEPYGPLGPFSAMFVLSSRGFVGHGSGSAIYYFPNPRNPFGDSVPLQGTPGHWFYRQTSSAR
jgi:hypothetical protein